MLAKPPTWGAIAEAASLNRTFMIKEIPDFPNFYSLIFNLEKDEFVKLFENNGWKIRKSSWTEFEYSNNWSEFNVASVDENNVILNGSIINNSQNIELLINYFNDFDSKYQFELYDESGNLIFERKK